jgi:hypothetical protein
MDRHSDWAVILGLIGGGQEINTGEAGIAEWLDILQEKYPNWRVHLSPKLSDSEYASGQAVDQLRGHPKVVFKDARAEAGELGSRGVRITRRPHAAGI